jgi:hypothetical protein
MVCTLPFGDQRSKPVLLQKVFVSRAQTGVHLTSIVQYRDNKMNLNNSVVLHIAMN